MKQFISLLDVLILSVIKHYLHWIHSFVHIIDEHARDLLAYNSKHLKAKKMGLDFLRSLEVYTCTIIAQQITFLEVVFCISAIISC